MDPDHGTRNGAVGLGGAERPDLLDEALGNRHQLFLDDEVDVVDRAREDLRGRRGIERVLGSVRVGLDVGCRCGPAVVVTSGRGAIDRDSALHAGRFVTGDGADEGDPGVGNRDLHRLRYPGVNETARRAVGKGDVVRDRAVVGQLDLVRAGLRYLESSRFEHEVDGVDLECAEDVATRALTVRRRGRGASSIGTAGRVGPHGHVARGCAGGEHERRHGKDPEQSRGLHGFDSLVTRGPIGHSADRAGPNTYRDSPNIAHGHRGTDGPFGTSIRS